MKCADKQRHCMIGKCFLSQTNKQIKKNDYSSTYNILIYSCPSTICISCCVYTQWSRHCVQCSRWRHRFAYVVPWMGQLVGIKRHTRCIIRVFFCFFFFFFFFFVYFFFFFFFAQTGAHRHLVREKKEKKNIHKRNKKNIHKRNKKKHSQKK